MIIAATTKPSVNSSSRSRYHGKLWTRPASATSASTSGGCVMLCDMQAAAADGQFLKSHCRVRSSCKTRRHSPGRYSSKRLSNSFTRNHVWGKHVCRQPQQSRILWTIRVVIMDWQLALQQRECCMTEGTRSRHQSLSLWCHRLAVGAIDATS